MMSGQKGTDAEIMDCGGVFEQLDDLLNVPNDDVGEATEAASLPPMDLDLFLPAAPFPCSDSVFSNLDISAELSVPCEDIVQLEWLPSFVEDSFSCGASGLTVDEPPKGCPGRELSDHQFRTSSPVSVLDSSSSCSVEKTSAVTVATSRCGRARSKRPWPKTVNFRQITAPPLPPLLVACARTKNSDESNLMIPIPRESNPEHKKKKKNKKIKFTLPAAAAADGAPPSQPIRKCLHCEITKTPQWRAGPMGPKTLCNACGVHCKSGWLFPKYRPAASPTFVPTVHSNSHKKVLEMRNKVDCRVPNRAIELIPNTRVGVDRV